MSVTTVTTQGWFSRLFNSIIGVFIGIGLFFCSFGVIWYNEGRTNLSVVAEESVAISAASVDSNNEGQLVAAAGKLVGSEPIGDGSGYIKAGDYLLIDRNVEMYAWVEKKETETTKNTGGSETTTTKYSYVKEWTDNPEDSDNFQNSAGHQNPSLTIEEATFRPSAASLGAFAIDINNIDLPSADSLSLNESNLGSDTGFTAEGNYLFKGAGSLGNPQVGDVRLSFEVVPSNIDVTLFGKQEGNKITTYLHDGEDRLYRAFTSNREEAIATLNTEFQTMRLILHGVGFLMMWIGLSMIFGPLTTFLDVIPFLGNLSRTMINILTFAVSFVISAIAILISILLHSPIFLFILFLLIVAGGAGFYYWRTQQPGKAA